MHETHFKLQRLADGKFSATLASRMGEMLGKAEELFGPRNEKAATFIGIEFHDAVPQLHFPTPGHVIIRLSLETLDDLIRAQYQLAHEVVHLLSAERGLSAPVLEEGAATWFAQLAIGRPTYTSCPKYRHAATAVRELLTFRPNAIKELRAKEEGWFRRISAQTFSEAGVTGVSQELITFLCRDFYLWGGAREVL